MNSKRSLSARLVMLASVGALAGALSVPFAALADDGAPASGPSINGILAGSWQHANGSNADLTNGGGEANLQLDLLLGLPMGPGAWNMEVKAGTTPRNNGGVSTVFPEATGLVGETVNADNEGQGAITQFFYRITPTFATLDAGLLFSPAYLDTNDIADDEYRQFQGTTFVNNPTIPLPVYAMGGAAQGSVSKTFGYTVFVSSTADLQGSTYSNLFDFGGKGHGVFGAGEMNWAQGNLSGNVGLWQNNDDSFTNFSSGQPETDYGVYGNLNGSLGSDALHWNVRLGWANPRVSQANTFVGGELAYDTKLPFGANARPVTYGFGVSHTGVSSDMPDPKANFDQAEVYARAKMTKHVSFTADLQYLHHSQFDPSNGSTWVEGIRMGAEF